MCGAWVGNFTILEQKPGEPFKTFVNRAVPVNIYGNRDRFVSLENLYVCDGLPGDWQSMRLYYGAEADREKVYRPSHRRGRPIRWQ